MCLLGLQEIQKYWRINNNVLDLFLQYLDTSIAHRLHGGGAQSSENTLQNIANIEPQMLPGEQLHETTPASDFGGGERYDFPTPQTQAQTRIFEDQYFNMLYGPWEGDDGMADLGLVLQVDDPLQMSGLNILERSL